MLRTSSFRFAPRAALPVVLFGVLAAGPVVAQAPENFPKGVVIPKVACQADATQSYALYLPSSYTPEKKWPIVYAFDPGGQGQNPVEQMKEFAEQYGYILAGSNNSRNGPRRAQVDAANAMLKDTGARVAIDVRRVYFTGFSGGARVAGMVSFLCDRCSAGVIAHGADVLLDNAAKDVYFPVFFTIGEEDFNSEEVVRLSRELEDINQPNRVRVFPGPHQWPPAEVWADAFAWLELLAMKEGKKPRDQAFVDGQRSRSVAAGEKLEQNFPYDAYEHYRRLAREFEGLAPVNEIAAKAAALKASPAVREGRGREDAEFRRSKEYWEELARILVAIRQDYDGRGPLLSDLRGRSDALRARAEGSRDPRQAIVIRRALAMAFAQAIEEGLGQLREKNFRMAVANLQAAAEINPTIPWPFYSLARAYAQMGDRRNCFRSLEKAAKAGMRNAALLSQQPEFAAWREHPDFQKIVQQVEANAQKPVN